MKVRNPRQAGGVAAWSAVADMWLHISALLCFADLCGSLLFMACNICWVFSLLSFVFESSRPLVYHVDLLGFISHISFYAQQWGRYVAFTRDYGFVCWILNWLVYWVNPFTAPTTISFPPSLVQQIVDAVKASLTGKKRRINLQRPALWVNYCPSIYCAGCAIAIYFSLFYAERRIRMPKSVTGCWLL